MKDKNLIKDTKESESLNTKSTNKIVTPEDKKLYVNNFLYYNFHKINRYIPVEEIHLEDESSDSEYDDDFYDYQ